MRSFPHLGLKEFMPYFEAAGGALEMEAFLVEPGDPVADAEALHRAAAIRMIRSYTEAFNYNCIALERRGILDKAPEPFQCDPDKLQGREISWEQFIGAKDGDPHASNSYPALFLDPPYTLSLKKEESEHLLENSYRQLCPDPSNPPVIYSWNTDWADYFKAGMEWWGTALWTVASDHGPSIIVIAASSTD